MASSSKAHNIIDPLNADQEVEEGKKGVEEERDWLELSLGFGSSSKQLAPILPSSSSSSSLPLPQQKQIELGLGLGFGCCNENTFRNHQFFIPPENLHYDLPSSLWQFHYPLRPQCGLWFTLCASVNRDGEMGLPQIPKAYIRVKDEKVTVFMVKTYLVTKLGLSNEAEMLHSQTLKHVRDTIWLPRLTESVNLRAPLIPISDAIAVNHLMSLVYGRRYFSN